MPAFGDFDDENACVLAGMLQAVLIGSTINGKVFKVGFAGRDAEGFYENAIPVVHDSGLRYDVIVRWRR